MWVDHTHAHIDSDTRTAARFSVMGDGMSEVNASLGKRRHTPWEFTGCEANTTITSTITTTVTTYYSKPV